MFCTSDECFAAGDEQVENVFKLHSHTYIQDISDFQTELILR